MLAIYLKKQLTVQAIRRLIFQDLSEHGDLRRRLAIGSRQKSIKEREAVIVDGDKVRLIPTNEIGIVIIASQSGVCYVKIDGTFKIKAVNLYDIERIES